MVLRIFWPVMYLIGGVLPAFGLALLSSVFMMFGEAFGILIGLFAWSGTVGLALAALNRPSVTGYYSRRFISLMLIMGLVAITPPLVGSLTHPSNKIWFSVAMISPTLLALFYLGEMLRTSSSCE
jgi:hypothetical protein